MSLLSALTSAILPVLSVAGAGYLLGRFRDVETDALATVTIYVLMPALVFHSLSTTEIDLRTASALLGGVVAFSALMIAAGELAGRALGEREPTLGAFVLAGTFPNAGNYGIPLADFAFGEVGRSTAILFITAQIVVMYTAGVYIATRGTAGSQRDAALEIFRLPLVYAVAAAAVARALGAVPPPGSAALSIVRLTGDAAIPVMLLMLGIQLANARAGTAIRRVVPVSALKLFVAPAVGLVVAVALGLGGDVGRVFVLACAMPSAVTPLMLAVEYGGRDAAEYLSAAILVSTLASVGTLAALIAILQSGTLL